MEQIGNVTVLRRFPVKSMAGEELPRGFVSYSGLQGDRVFALLGAADKKFPWITARQHRALVLCQPRFVQPPDLTDEYPDLAQLAVTVRLPDGVELAVTDPRLLEWLQGELGAEVSLRFSERGMPDARPLSLIGEATIDALSDEVGVTLDARRFRPNLQVRWSSAQPFFEDSLVDRRLQLGEQLIVLVSKKDARCQVIGIDPDTAELDRRVLQTVSQRHDGNAGVYLVVLREGVVERDSPIYLLPR